MSNPQLSAREGNERAVQRMQALIAGYANSMPPTNFDNAHARAIEFTSATVDVAPNTIRLATARGGGGGRACGKAPGDGARKDDAPGGRDDVGHVHAGEAKCVRAGPGV